jgi:DNA polymerase-4
MSNRMFAILREYTELVEPLSIDEAFLDVTGSQRLFGAAVDIGRKLKARIRAELGLIASIGLAPNKFLAKVGSDLGKPDGFVVVAPGQEGEFLATLPISRLWGVGPKMEARLRQMGFQTIGQIARTSPDTLDAALGQVGRDLWDLARGRDDRPVEPEQEAKSVGSEHTFSQDTADRDLLRKTMLGLADRVAQRLREDGLLARGVTLKFRDHRFHTVTRAVILDRPTDVGDDLFGAVWALLAKLDWTGKKVRLVGVTATRLESNVRPVEQMSLFTGSDARRDLARTVDTIRARFGREAITRASLLPETRQTRSERHKDTKGREGRRGQRTETVGGED